MISLLRNRLKFVRNNKDYNILLTSQGLSVFGDSLETIALLYLVFEITGSTIAMGMVMFFNLLPNLILSPFSGVLADMYSRKRIMILSESMRGLIVLYIPVALYYDFLTINHIYLVSFLVSIFETFFSSANTATLPNILDKKYIEEGYSIISSSMTLMKLIGYMFGGIIIQGLGYISVYIFDSITFFISGFAISRLVLNQCISKENNIRSFFINLQRGLSYIKAKRIFHVIVFVAIIVNFIITPINIIITYSVESIFKLSKTHTSLGFVAILLGSLIGSALYPSFSNKISKKRIIISSIGCIGLGFTLGGLILNYYVLILGFFIVSIFAGLASVGLSLLFVETVDDEYRCRAGSVLNVLVLVAAPLSGSLIGIFLDYFGLELILKTGGALIVSCIFLLAYLWTDSHSCNQVK